MSIPVAPDELASAAVEHGPAAYVLTVGDDGRPRVIHTAVEVAADGAIGAEVGRGAAANAAARPDVCVLWPPAADGYSLIADGAAVVDGEPRPGARVTIRVTSAVRHRPAPV